MGGFPFVLKVGPIELRYFPSNTFRSRLLLLTFEECDIFVRATGVNHDGGKLPALRSLGIRLIE